MEINLYFGEQFKDNTIGNHHIYTFWDGIQIDVIHGWAMGGNFVTSVGSYGKWTISGINNSIINHLPEIASVIHERISK